MAGIPKTDPDNPQYPFPSDLRAKRDTIIDRDQIIQSVRYSGMMVYVSQEEKIYYLKGGIDNSNFKRLLDEDDLIQGAYIPFSWVDSDANLSANSDQKIATQKAVKSYVDGVSRETVIPTLGTLNNLDIPTGFARFTGQGQVILTGVNIGDLQGKDLTIRNETGQELTIIHESPSSAAGNTFWINGIAANLPLGDNCSARFKYSISEQRWQLVEVWGNGYSPNLIGDDERVVVANPDGTTSNRESFVFEANRDDVTVWPTPAFLNSEYPDALEGFRVYCKNIVGGGAVFRLHDQVNKIWCYQQYTELS